MSYYRNLLKKKVCKKINFLGGDNIALIIIHFVNKLTKCTDVFVIANLLL